MPWSSQCRMLIVIDELGPFHQQLHQKSTLRESIVPKNPQRTQLCYGGFNRCLQAVFSQLSFENFWLYISGARLF